MRNLYIGILIAVLAFNTVQLHAQVQNTSVQLEDLVLPSPNAAALGKYGDVPVSLYTGQTNIEIPIYDVKDRDLHVSISLRYRSSGVLNRSSQNAPGIWW